MLYGLAFNYKVSPQEILRWPVVMFFEAVRYLPQQLAMDLMYWLHGFGAFFADKETSRKIIDGIMNQIKMLQPTGKTKKEEIHRAWDILRSKFG